MPNIASAKKRLRQTERRTKVNRARRSRMRGYVRNVEEAIAGGDKSVAEAALRVAEPELARGAQKGIVPRNTAQRKVSQLTRRVQAMES
ncbi:MAG: 30S ribosomal protein S20 [Alphaproteobacteria bacterium]|nr:30S ribosomal protein S20 [Alphaproteobacteria bacterium]